MSEENRLAAIIVPGFNEYPATEFVAGMHPLRRLILSLKLAGVTRIVHSGEPITRKTNVHAAKLGAVFVTPHKTKTKNLSHWQNTFKYLTGKCERVLIIPANFSLVDITTIRLMSEVDAEIAVPTFGGKRGWPLLMPLELFSELVSSGGDLEALLAGHPPLEVEVSDEGAVADVTTDIDAETIDSRLTLNRQMRPLFKVSIGFAEPFWGRGIQQVIGSISETGSLLTSSNLLAMAADYTRRLIRDAEDGMGEKIFIVDRNPMAPTLLTEAGKDFSDKYAAFYDDCERCILEMFNRHFGN